MSKIFLCHTSIDKPFVRKLAAELQNYGHTVWIDEAEINIGDSLIGKIREGLDSVDYVAVILSKASVNSEWVRRELEIASNKEIKQKKVIVLPLIIEKVELPGFLEGKFYGDFSEVENYDKTLDLLLRSLGDSKKVEQTKEENQLIQDELAQARKIIEHYKKTIDTVTEYNFSTKSENLKRSIIEDNEKNPNYAPINNVYGFEVAGSSVTLSYLLWAIGKARRKGSHPLEALLTICNQWGDAQRMLRAYSDMINFQK